MEWLLKKHKQRDIRLVLLHDASAWDGICGLTLSNEVGSCVYVRL